MMYHFYSSPSNYAYEYCYNVDTVRPFSNYELSHLMYILSPEHRVKRVSRQLFNIIEYGPKLQFESPWAMNMKTILHRCGITSVKRIERTIRVAIQEWISKKQEFDPIIHSIYRTPIQTFQPNTNIEQMYAIPIEQLETINDKLGLSFDVQDMQYYTHLFRDIICRPPTNVELFDLSQSNSEHSRHWFFNGSLQLNGNTVPQTLFQMVKSTLLPHNSVVAFSDNSSAIRGHSIHTIIPSPFGSQYKYSKSTHTYNIVFTAETHNFPTGIAPFSGAATGIGGRIRDNQSIGRGGLIIGSTAGYCVGNLFLPNYSLPWETRHDYYNDIDVLPSKILIEASNGASDYGNKIGEPIINGFARSFNITTPNGETVEWIKPIMFTGGIGQMDANHNAKNVPAQDMNIVRIGGPAYKIGVGGGSASSRVQDSKHKALDITAVQRGDPEMENKLNRVVRTCIEMGDANPIESIHDQGAGGLANVIKEIIEPFGGSVDIRAVTCGDSTMNALELWTAEFQESNTCLIDKSNVHKLQSICARENLPCDVLGCTEPTGEIEVYDSKHNNYPVKLKLEHVLSNVPQKQYTLINKKPQLYPFIIPHESIETLVSRIFKLVSVGSKQFLTNKVDRSVTGLIAQQQCVGPKHLPISDYALIAQSHFGITGAVTAIGEQPIKGLLCPKAMAKMTVGELVTNIMWTKIPNINHIKCSGNWMCPLQKEGSKYELYEACQSMCDTMKTIGLSIDGGKDSLSMSTKLQHKTIHSPTTLVLSGYADCPDIQNRVTADFKRYGNIILFIDLGNNKNRLGGSALVQTYNQLGNECPTLEQPLQLKQLFNVIQTCIDKKYIVAGHDKSDGGLITTILEMCFPSRLGCSMEFSMEDYSYDNVVKLLFNEELGVVIEVDKTHITEVHNLLREFTYSTIGTLTNDSICTISCNHNIVLKNNVVKFLTMWQETSCHLEYLQCSERCVNAERAFYASNKLPYYYITNIVKTKIDLLSKPANNIEILRARYKVAIIREEGSNGDREMASAFYMAGFDVHDVTSAELVKSPSMLQYFCGIVFVGGFSFSDVLGAGQGWNCILQQNKEVRAELIHFYTRSNTFSLGVCNGCQLMTQFDIFEQVQLNTNKSDRFESRFSTVKINQTNAIMLKTLAGCKLGVWTAHKEGQFTSAGDSTIAIQYIDTQGHETTDYPYNPNGSVNGTAGVCSPDGRHLIMMPHPERTFLNWQAPYVTLSLQSPTYYPWILMFKDAYDWVRSMDVAQE